MTARRPRRPTRPAFAGPGTYVWSSLTVTDDTGDSTTATATVTVLAKRCPDRPVINAAPQNQGPQR